MRFGEQRELPEGEEQLVNRQEMDVLASLMTERFVNQRLLAETTGYSLGTVNKSLKSLSKEGYVDESFRVTEKGVSFGKDRSPENAVILAAGFGMRMVPINTVTPKALIEINGEPLIERLIRQLRESGISDITVVAGFMKERFDYLIDEYDIRLVVNSQYAAGNNLLSLSLAAEQLGNTYIIPCDIWCRKNPFRKQELYSWYMISDETSPESDVKINRKMELVRVPKGESGNQMIGIAYVCGDDAVRLRARLLQYADQPAHHDDFWEEALYEEGRMVIPARLVEAADYSEINTYEQLRDLDGTSNHLQSDTLDLIADVFHVGVRDIADISVLKKGMTNRSFLFSVRGGKYIMRIPGEGTDQLINRREEADVFHTISGLGLCDDPVYINPDNGYKITKYLNGIRVADPENEDDLRKCMSMLRHFHSLELKVPHTFDIFRQIEFYEQLWNGSPSIYKDYRKTKEQVMSLVPYIEQQEKKWVLTHIDAVPDNFLFYQEDGEEKLQLTDWEYAGMQDPHVDIAMFCIYSLYDKKQTDHLIDLYFEGDCLSSIRAKIYCYVAACGLLWSNWCEYKRSFGVEFGEYSLRQYRYAKDFYKYALKEMKDG